LQKLTSTAISQLQDKWQTVLENFPPQNITAAKIAETLDENPEPRLQQVRIKKDTYALLAKKAAAAGLSFSELLDRIGDDTTPKTLRSQRRTLLSKRRF
jgi:hypothetical protein